MSDLVACPLLVVFTFGADRCTLPGPSLPALEAVCMGLPGRCTDGLAREREIRRRDEAARMDRPASVWVRLARREAARR